MSPQHMKNPPSTAKATSGPLSRCICSPKLGSVPPARSISAPAMHATVPMKM
jgi:hypothetical protein